MSRTVWNPRAKRHRKGKTNYDLAVERVKKTPRHFVSADELIQKLYPSTPERQDQHSPP